MNFAEIEKLITVFEKSNLGAMEIEENGLKIRLEKTKNNIKNESTNDNTINNNEIINNGNYVTSPLVGTFHSSQYVGAEAFVKKGDIVKKGDKLCIIEAMKVMNEITSPFDGKIIDIFKNDGDMVDFGANLFLIGE